VVQRTRAPGRRLAGADLSAGPLEGPTGARRSSPSAERGRRPSWSPVGDRRTTGDARGGRVGVR
jgi:hypothetical protein